MKTIQIKMLQEPGCERKKVREARALQHPKVNWKKECQMD